VQHLYGVLSATSSDVSFGALGGIYQGAFRGGGTVTINGSSIHDNGTYGIQNTSPGILDAKGNWWGDPSGPYNEISNLGGLGNSVSQNVDFGDLLATNPLEPS
jgi:hypothetical protein